MIIQHLTYKCDVCGTECKNCVTSRNLQFNVYLNEQMAQRMQTDIIDICENCNAKIQKFIVELREESMNKNSFVMGEK